MAIWTFSKKTEAPQSKDAPPGRDIEMPVTNRHFVLGTPIKAPFPEGTEQALFGLGCFWGAEKKFWEAEGVYTTAAGYSAGQTPNPSYQEVCSGRTGHNEVVLVVFRPERIAYEQVLRIFWENHDPTQGMRQGNDVGTQYRSGIYTFSEEQERVVATSKEAFQRNLRTAGFGSITTEVEKAGAFYYAEDYHQQYLAKNPGGYCGLGGTGVSCPSGLDIGEPL